MSGEEYNYIVFGQENYEEDDEKEVVRICVYDKEFNFIDSLSVNDCYTIVPFNHGSLRMAENEGELIIHTSRTRYTTEDGLNHQSQLTLVVDMDEMRVTNDLGRFQENHVSHSFNQFVKYDEDIHVLVDHGDAYPRSVVLNKYNGSWYTEIDLFEIPGTIGANCTGVTLGGFEVSENNYLVAINTIDHTKVSEYTSFDMIGLEKDERDVVLLVSEKSNEDYENVTKVYYTDYVDSNCIGSTPYLVKLTEDTYVLIWEEFEWDDYRAESNGVKYVFVDENGNELSDIYSDENAQLSSDCQPVVIDGNIVWYINSGNSERVFYEINTKKDFTGITFEDKSFTYDGRK